MILETKIGCGQMLCHGRLLCNVRGTATLKAKTVVAELGGLALPGKGEPALPKKPHTAPP